MKKGEKSRIIIDKSYGFTEDTIQSLNKDVIG